MTLRRALPLLALLAVPPLLAACSDQPDTSIEELPFASAESAVRYEAVIENAPNDDIRDIAEQSLRIFRRQEDGANSVALLRRRAQQDIEIATKILRAYGWYEADAEVEVEAPGAEEMKAYEEALAAWRRRNEGPSAEAEGGRDAAQTGAEARPEPPLARAVLRMIPGPRYTLASHRFILVDQGEGAVPVLPPASSLGAPIGEPAEAAEILDAESAALTRLREDGRPWAQRRTRRAVADPVEKTIEVETVIATGPAAVYGATSISGAESVSKRFLRSYQPWQEGATATPEGLKRYQKDLALTDLFDSVSVRLPETPPEDAPLTAEGAVIAPVTIEAEESEPRTASAGLRWSADVGPEVNLGFIHRNIFNAGERLELDATAGLTEQVFEAVLRKPQFWRPGQELALSGKLFNESDDAYDSTGIELAASVNRKLTDKLTVGAGGLLEFSRTAQNGPRRNVILGGLPLFVNWDNSDSALDPKSGARAQIKTTPFLSSIDSEIAPFLLIDGTATGYQPLDDDKNWVLAGRVRLASILSAELSDVPATRRLYAGGGGSVRGYATDFIGPLDASNDPTGGRSALELGAELRTPLWGPVRGALFVEGGSVTTEIVPTFSEGLQVAAGFGVRYGSPAGPIRLDIAFPLNAREVDDPVQLYISIGQAW